MRIKILRSLFRNLKCIRVLNIKTQVYNTLNKSNKSLTHCPGCGAVNDPVQCFALYKWKGLRLNCWNIVQRGVFFRILFNVDSDHGLLTRAFMSAQYFTLKCIFKAVNRQKETY